MTAAAATEMPGRIPFEEIYTQHRKYVYLICYGVLRNEDDAQEATQETFLSVFGKISTFRGDCNVRTWLYRIAINKALKEIRRRRSHPEDVSFDQPRCDDEGGVHFQEIAAPDHALETVLLAIDIERALGCVRSGDKAVVGMLLEGYSSKEIGEVLGATVVAARSIVFRTRESLRNACGRPR